MKTSFSVLPLILVALCAAAYAQDKPAAPPADRFVLTKVRLLPKPGTADRLAGARVTGSNEGPTNAFVALAKIDRAPADDGWLELAVPRSLVYRFVKFESAKGKAVALAELEFYSPAGRLQGKPFGTSGPKGSSGNTFQKAFDGDPKTWFEAPTDNSYVGIDLGPAGAGPGAAFHAGRWSLRHVPRKCRSASGRRERRSATRRMARRRRPPTARSTEGRSPWPRTRASRPWPFKTAWPTATFPWPAT